MTKPAKPKSKPAPRKKPPAPHPRRKRKAAPNHSRKAKPDLRARALRGPDSRPDTPMAERVRAAMLVLETGQPPERCADELAAHFGVAPRQARRYIRKAREKITKLLEREAPHARGQRIRRLMVASRLAEARKDPRGLVAAEKEIAELQGLYTKHVSLTGGLDVETAGLLKAISLNPHDQRRRMAELEAKERAAAAPPPPTPEGPKDP